MHIVSKLQAHQDTRKKDLHVCVGGKLISNQFPFDSFRVFFILFFPVKGIHSDQVNLANMALLVLPFVFPF